MGVELRKRTPHGPAPSVRFSLPLVILLVLLLCHTALAAEWTSYTDANRVSGSDIDGTYLWVGTTGGVVRWDLSDDSYVKFTPTDGLADCWIKDVFVDDAGNKWFGTIEGVQKYDGTNWTTYNTSNSPLPHNTVFAIAQDNLGTMWFGTSYGIASFDGSTWNVYTDLGGGATNVAVRGIGVDSLNRIWTGNNPDDYGDPGGVSVFDGVTWTRHDPSPTSIGQYMLSLTVDGNGNVWAGSWTDGAHKYDGVAWVTYDASNSDLMGDQIECFAVEQDSIMWIANHTSSTGGVSRYDGTTWTNYNPGNSGIGDHRIYSISISGDDKYFGTGILGVSKFDGASWSFYATSNEPHCNYITSIDRDNAGSIYFGTMFYGVAVLNAGTWSYYYSGNSGLGDDYVNCVYVDPTGTLWVGTQYSGTYKYDGMSWTNYNTSNSGLLGDIILSITMDSLGNLWLGTAGWDGPGGQNGALAKFDGSTWTNYYLENSGLIDDDGLTVTVDHGDTVWVGTEEGVSKFNQFTGSWTDYTTADGLVDNRVERIAIDSKNDKWFATLGGVSEFDGASWKSYTETDGIASNSVKDIAVDADKVWIATANGMSVFEEGAWATYRQTDGLVDNNVTSVRVDASGYAWFGTDRSGISRFDDSGAGVPATEGPARLRLVAYPNPFRENLYVRYEAEVGGEAGHAMKIYDLSGRLVRSIQPPSSGSGTIMWDGKNETGQEITTGIYFIRVQTASGKTLGTEKAIFVR